MIGYAFCGSFCTVANSIASLKLLCEEGDVQPIVSENFAANDTRFGRADEIIADIEQICGKRAIRSIIEAEPLGPARPLEALVIAPCTGNTLAKIAHGITDTTVTMAAKAHLRAGRPLLIALASNDAMSANLENIAHLCMRKNIYFVPMKQDDPEKKPYSLVADFDRVAETLACAEEGKQLRPLFL